MLTLRALVVVALAILPLTAHCGTERVKPASSAGCRSDKSRTPPGTSLLGGTFAGPPQGKALIYVIDVDHRQRGWALNVCVDGTWIATVPGRSEIPIILASGKHDLEVTINNWTHHHAGILHLAATADLPVNSVEGKTEYILVGVEKQGPIADAGANWGLTSAWRTNSDEGRLLLASTASSTNQTEILRAEAACGPPAQRLKVQLAQNSGSTPPSPAMSMIYVIQGRVPWFHLSEVRVGMDGRWIGALRGRSYLAIRTQPGVHHFCIAGGNLRPSSVALDVLDTESKKSEYLEARTFSDAEISSTPLLLNEICETDGQAMTKRYRLSTVMLMKK